MREPRQETNQGFTRAAYISDEALEAIFEGLAEGKDPLAALCRAHGTSVNQFNRRCDREPELAQRRDEAYEVRKLSEPAELEAEVYRQAREGNWPALKMLMIVKDSEWRQTFAQSRLELSSGDGSATAFIAWLAPRLSDGRLQEVIAILEEAKEPPPFLEIEEGEVIELPRAEER